MKGLIFRHRRMRRHLSEAQRDAVIVDEGSPQFNFAKSWKGQGRFLAAEGGEKAVTGWIRRRLLGTSGPV